MKMGTPREFDGTRFAYERLRNDVLLGRLAPGTPLSQVRIANELGIGRGPLREAMRLLEREGLMSSEFNQRMKVAPLDLADLEHAYSMRIALEPIAIRTSIPHLPKRTWQELEASSLLDLDPRRDSDDEVIDQHAQFHERLNRGAPEQLVEDCRRLLGRTERYRRFWSRTSPSHDALVTLAHAEHMSIYRAALSGDIDLACELTVAQLARTARQFISAVDPHYEAAELEAAVIQAGGLRRSSEPTPR
jgi:DNA-binding GntR family transcriptional regulator